MVVVNQSTQATDADVQNWMSAVQTQCDTDVSKAWGVTCKMSFISKTTPIPSGMWVMGVFDNADQAGEFRLP